MPPSASSRLTAAQSAHLIQKHIQQFPNKQWDRNSLTQILATLDAPPPPIMPLVKPARVVVQELLSTGTGKERKERRAAATVAQSRPVRLSRPKTATTSRRGRSRSRSCRSCSRSRSPSLRLPDSPPTPIATHPPASKANIHPHAFVVNVSSSSSVSERPSTAPAKANRKAQQQKKAKAQLLDPPAARISSATLARLATKAIQAKQQPAKRKESRGIQSVAYQPPNYQNEEKEQDNNDAPSEGEQSKATPPPRVAFAEPTQTTSGSLSQTPRGSSNGNTTAAPIDYQSMRAAGLPSAHSSAREGQRNWLFPDTTNTTLTTGGENTTAAPAPLPTPKPTPLTGVYVPQPYIPQRSTHNDQSFNVFSHDGSADADSPSSLDQTSSYREISERIKNARYGHVLTSKPQDLPIPPPTKSVDEWEQKQQEYMSFIAQAQKRENSQLASINARKTRPEGGVSWWPDDTAAEVEGVECKIDDRESRRKSKKYIRDVERGLGQRRAGVVTQETGVEEQARTPKKVYKPPQPHQHTYPQPQQQQQPQQPQLLQSSASSRTSHRRQVVSSPERLQSAHYDIPLNESAAQPPKSPFRPLKPADVLQYTKTFRPVSDMDPLPPHGRGEQHRYDLHHRRDSESSEGDYSFKNHRGRMREELKRSRRAAQNPDQPEDFFESKQQQSQSQYQPSEGAMSVDEFAQSYRETSSPPPPARSPPRSSFQGSTSGRPYHDQVPQGENERQRQAQATLQQLINQQREEEARRILEARQNPPAPVYRAPVAFDVSISPANDSHMNLDSTIGSVLSMASNPLVKAFTTNPVTGRNAVSNAALIASLSPSKRPTSNLGSSTNRIQSPYRPQSNPLAASIRRSPSTSPVRSSTTTGSYPLSPSRLAALSPHHRLPGSPSHAALSASLAAASVAAASVGAVGLSTTLAHRAMEESFAEHHEQRAYEAEGEVAREELKSAMSQMELEAIKQQHAQRAAELQAQVIQEQNRARELQAELHRLQAQQLAAATAITIPQAVRDIVDGTSAANMVSHFAASQMNLNNSTVPPLSNNGLNSSTTGGAAGLGSSSSSGLLNQPSSYSSSSLLGPSSSSSGPLGSPSTAARTLSSSLSNAALAAQAQRERDAAAAHTDYAVRMREQRQAAERRMEELTKKAMKENEAWQAKTKGMTQTELPRWPMGGGGQAPSALNASSLSTISSLGRTHNFGASGSSASGSQLFPSFANVPTSSTTGFNHHRIDSTMSAGTPSSLSTGSNSPHLTGTGVFSIISSASNSPLLTSLDHLHHHTHHAARSSTTTTTASSTVAQLGSNPPSSQPSRAGFTRAGGDVEIESDIDGSLSSEGERDDGSVDESLTSFDD